MNRTCRALGFALAAFGLFACDRMDRASSPAPSAESTGSARIKLPSFPEGYRPDSVVDSGGQAVFQLTITGPGMFPIQSSWYLDPGSAERVLVSDIPVGKLRVFTGRLLWMSLAGDSMVTHEGRDSVAISSDAVAEVALYLRKLGSGGSAEVCVDVEGWGADSACVNPPPPIDTILRPDISGCWVAKVSYGNTGRVGKLTISQWDSTVSMVLAWPSGVRDSSSGLMSREGGVLYMGSNYSWGHGFYLKGIAVGAGDSINASFRGTDDKLIGTLSAFRTGCDTVVVPPIDTLVVDTVVLDTAQTCYLVAQNLKGGKSGSGSLALRNYGAYATGTFTWDGFKPMTVYGTLSGRPQDSTHLELSGIAPKGMLDSAGVPADTLHYRATIRPYPASGFAGSAFRLLRLGYRDIGIWKASPQSCPVVKTRP